MSGLLTERESDSGELRALRVDLDSEHSDDVLNGDHAAWMTNDPIEIRVRVDSRDEPEPVLVIDEGDETSAPIEGVTVILGKYEMNAFRKTGRADFHDPDKDVDVEVRTDD